jgi:hypothetical protein
MAFRPESTLNPKTLRREAVQLAVVAVASVGIYFTGVRALQIVVGVVDMFACVITAIAATVAWRVGGRGASVGLYAIAVPLFAAIAILNFA